MIKPDKSLVLTLHELYVMAAIYGLPSIPGFKGNGNTLPDSEELPEILITLMSRGLITAVSDAFVLSSDGEEIISCYKNSTHTVFLQFFNDSIPDICCSCFSDTILCAEKMLRQPDAVKMFSLPPDEVCNYLVSNNYLDRIPRSRPPYEQQIENDEQQTHTTVLRIQWVAHSGESKTWDFFEMDKTVYLMDSGSIMHTCLSETVKLIAKVLSSNKLEEK